MSSQTVLITGALTGIGRATAFAFAKAGSAVVEPHYACILHSYEYWRRHSADLHTRVRALL